MSAICNLVQIRAELLKVNLKSGVDPSSNSYVSLAQEAIFVILKQIRAVGKLNCDQATYILKLATDEPIFNQAQLSELREVVNDKLDQQGGGPATTATPSTRRFCSRRCGHILTCAKPWLLVLMWAGSKN